MNNKPFWQDKTCKEMAGLHVKVTFKNGDAMGDYIYDHYGTETEVEE